MSTAGVEPVELREDGAFVFHHPPKYGWTRDALPPRQCWERYSVYVHVPFCRRICTFCTFERKRIGKGSMQGFVDHLWRELDVVAATDDLSAAAIHSVYLGGGTASLMSNDAIARLLDDLRTRFGLGDDAEVTLECEPGTKREQDFAVLRGAGVNRISIGVQAFQDDILKALNRSHDTAKAVAMVEAAKAGGFDNVHVDLMYGLPGQSAAMWEESVGRALALDVAHISTYQLIVFESELLSRQIRAGQARPLPSFEEIHAMRRHTSAAMPDAGLQRYSLTEFARPGYECDYVKTTWDGSDYLGLGPAAYSRNGSWLWENDTIHVAYQEKARAGRRPVGKSTRMTPIERLERDTAMGLCLLEIDVGDLAERAGAPADALDGELAALADAGLVQRDGDRVTLTTDGLRYSTAVAKCLTNR